MPAPPASTGVSSSSATSTNPRTSDPRCPRRCCAARPRRRRHASTTTSFYATHDIELLTGRTVEALDPDARHVRLDGDEHLPFTTAVVATGAEPRRLDVPGSDLAGVHYLRSIGDSGRLGDAIRAARRVAVIGAGWIGSEVAASARQMGADVVLIDPAPAPLHRVLGDQIGEVFRRLHADNGVQLRLRTGVAELRGTDTVEQVVLSDGDVEAADVVVIGVGVTPRVELAVAAGLKVDNGIVVDEQLQSSAPGVYAAGDVASAWHPHYGHHLRVEHWANALNQGLTAGANAAGGTDAPTPGCPTSSPISTTWAWSTSATATRPTRSRSAAASPTASSSPSGTATASSPQR